ncbi:MAG TPA: thiamine pyrophosphate-binding protein [Candidatus Competibacteraceae bacterium]|nr:thiamine pyrophosphate-binding protein [Candidatus Competibacteraceae bacterium]
MDSGQRTGGQILVQGLRTLGAELAFGVPGESYLAVLDALVDVPQLRFITCRQEGGAAMMAEAYGKLTGRPGICFVTRGPGATNASAGVHVAYQDSTPMILFIGQVARGDRDREAFQEIDYRRMYGQLAKWVAEIDQAERIPEYLHRAYQVATSGRPGPVVLALPEDMLTDTAKVADPAPCRPVEPYPDPRAMAELGERLARAQRPLLLLGEGLWSEQAWHRLHDWAAAWRLPVACAFRCQSAFDNRHECYVGDVGLGVNPALAARLRTADLILALGTRLGEIVTQSYTLPVPPRPAQSLIHVHPGAEELGRVYQADLYIHAGVQRFVAALDALPAPAVPAWEEWRAAARRDYLAWITPTTSPGELQLAEIMAWLREHLPPEAILCNGAGNYAVWLHRFYQYRGSASQLAPRCGSMGYGLPAAVAAKLVHPERPVLAFAGDGCFQMTLQELATAVQYGANIVVCVVDNSAYGTIRMHQERHYPTRVSGTDLLNPDFAALARAYGCYAQTVERTADFAAAFERALTAGRPALLHLKLPLEALTPRQTLSEIRAAATRG